jgi:hypothetical protein
LTPETFGVLYLHQAASNRDDEGDKIMVNETTISGIQTIERARDLEMAYKALGYKISFTIHPHDNTLTAWISKPSPANS